MLSRRAYEVFKGCIPFTEEDGDTVGMRRSLLIPCCHEIEEHANLSYLRRVFVFHEKSHLAGSRQNHGIEA